MATEQEMAERKKALLDAVAKRDWEGANKEMGWLSQNLTKNQLIGFYPDLLAALDQAMGEECKSPIAFTMRGYASNELGDHHGAIEDFNDAIQLESVNSKKVNIYKARAYFYRGISYDKLEDIQKSIASFKKSIKLKPDYANAYFHLGNARRKLNDFESAIENYIEAIRFNPDHAEAYNNCGIARFKLNDFHGSLSDLNNAIRLKPDNARYYNNRGNTKSDLGDIHGAISDYDYAIRLNPNNADVYHNRGLTRFQLANKNHKNKNKDLKEELERSGVIDDFRKALHLHPSKFRIKQFEDIILFVASLNKNIEFGKEEIDSRRISYEKIIKCFLTMNYILAMSILILLPSLFLIIDFEILKPKVDFFLNLLRETPLVVYIMLSLALLTPVLFPMIQTLFIHRLEYRTHQSKFPVEPTTDRKSTYEDENQLRDSLSPETIARHAHKIITWHIGDES